MGNETSRRTLIQIVGPWRATILSGLLFAASHPPFDFGPLILIAFVPWLLCLKDFRGPRSATFAGLAAGFVVYLLGLFYLSQMPSVGGSQAIMYVMWIFISAVVSIYYGLFAGVARWMIGRLPLGVNLFLIPLLWVGFEFGRYYFPVPGPMMMTGYTLHQIPVLIQIADLASTHLVVYFILLINTAIFVSIRAKALQAHRTQRLALVTLVVAFVANIAYGSLRLVDIQSQLKEDGPIVAVVQPNIQQDLKEEESESAREQRLWEHKTLSAQALRYRPDLIAWSETSFPWTINPERQTPRLRELKDFARSIDTPLLVGSAVPLLEKDREYYPYLKPDEFNEAWFNSAWLVSDQGELVARHDKTHIVPGGEYIPYRGTPLGDFIADYARELMGAIPALLPGYRRGTMQLTDKSGREWNFSASICYEFFFPHIYSEIHTPKNVDFAINLSNEAWYKGLAELDQALIATQFRAIESRTSFVRANNTGISALIDPTGRIRSKLVVDGKDRDVKGILPVSVPYFEDPQPTLFLRGGLWFGWLALASALGLMLISWFDWILARLKGKQDVSTTTSSPDNTPNT